VKYPRLANFLPPGEQSPTYDNDNAIMCAVCGTDTSESGWGTWCSRVCFNRDGESYEESNISSSCVVCGDEVDDAWVDLCGRGCYYDLHTLLVDYEMGLVAEPDERIVAYIISNPDGGVHCLVPDRIFTYIANKDRSAEWHRLAALAPERAWSSSRKLKKWIKRKLAKQRLRAHN
jgi:hypothetical protein